MMQPWFTDGKLGIFLHWGIYSVDGVAESWSFFNGQVPYDTYMAQLDGFEAQKWDPDAWADLFVEAGAAYAVLTAKHHDGVALWDTQAADLSVVKRTPAARDLITPYVDALRRRGLKVGLYYSHLDWSHPDYATVRPDGQDPDDRGNPYSMPAVGEESPGALGRLPRLPPRPGPRAPRALPAGPALVRRRVGAQPRTVAHGGTRRTHQGVEPAHRRQRTPHRTRRLRDTRTGRARRTAEGPLGALPHRQRLLGLPAPGRPPQVAPSTGPRLRRDRRRGGNLLLAVGPKADGTIPPEQAERLEALGEWIAGHRPAVRDTVRGLPHGHFYGPSTLSADRRTLYLFLFDRPNEYVVLRGVRNTVRSARVLGSGTDVRHERVGGLGEVPGWEYLYVDDDQLDPLCTVVALELDGELDLYREHTRD